MVKIELEIELEDGSSFKMLMPERSNNSIALSLVSDNGKTLDKKHFCVIEKNKITFESL